MATTDATAGVLTLPELVEALPALLAGGYGGVRSGRIRDLPDARTVRWYQTLGMVDRPAEFRGRTALYGRRHLLQLAAIKKLQSAGLSLSDIQRGLAGRNDAELARSAGVSLQDVDRFVARAVRTRSQRADAQLAAAVAGSPAAPSRRATAFWKATPAATTPAATETPVSAPPAPTGMQSASLGDAGLLLWNGRELTAAERATLARLTAPLVMFLTSVQPSSAGTMADEVSRKASSPRRPETGARP